jgi:hypothetical protein
MEDLIGKAPGSEIKNAETIEEWKENAKQKGLKVQN